MPLGVLMTRFPTLAGPLQASATVLKCRSEILRVVLEVPPVPQQRIRQARGLDQLLRRLVIRRHRQRGRLRVQQARIRQRVPARASQTGEANITSQYSATLGISSYELDLFGRVRSLSEEALQKYFATEEARRSTQISLVASVANAYLTWQADKELLKLTQDTLGAFEQSFKLTSRSNEVGVASALDLSHLLSNSNKASSLTMLIPLISSLLYCFQLICICALLLCVKWFS